MVEFLCGDLYISYIFLSFSCLQGEQARCNPCVSVPSVAPASSWMLLGEPGLGALIAGDPNTLPPLTFCTVCLRSVSLTSPAAIQDMLWDRERTCLPKVMC